MSREKLQLVHVQQNTLNKCWELEKEIEEKTALVDLCTNFLSEQKKKIDEMMRLYEALEAQVEHDREFYDYFSAEMNEIRNVLLKYHPQFSDEPNKEENGVLPQNAEEELNKVLVSIMDLLRNVHQFLDESRNF